MISIMSFRQFQIIKISSQILKLKRILLSIIFVVQQFFSPLEAYN